MSPTSRQSIPRWARAGAIAAIGVAAIGVAGPFGAPSGAQQASEPTEISDGPLDVAAASAGPRSLVISDDGAVVAYDSGSDTSDNRVVVRDRVEATTLLDVIGMRPGVSADGCTVAFSTTADAGGVVTTTLSAHDLCDSEPEQIVATAPGEVSAAPALSADGSSVVWSPGGAIARYVDGGAGYAPDTAFTPSLPAGRISGTGVDISADGSVVAFEVLPTAGTAAQTEVWVWDDETSDAAAVGGAGSHRPTISGDGSILAFESSDLALAADADPAPLTPFVVAHDRGAGETVVVAEESWRPSLSSDGHHLAYRQIDLLGVAWWGSGEPFASVGHRSLGRTMLADDGSAPDAPLAALSAHGRWSAFDGDAGATLTDDDADDAGTRVWVIEERPEGGGAEVVLGTVEVGDILDTTVSITNGSSAGAPLDGSVTVGSPFTIVSTTCEDASPDIVFVLHPGTSCTVRVRALTITEGAIAADVAYPVAGDPATSLIVPLSATVAATPTTTAPASSTPVASTAPPQTTLPLGTAPSRPPVFTIPRSSGGFPSSGGSGSSSSSGSAGSSGSSTGTTTTVAPSPRAFDPASFEFAPTIVDAGRRSATITLHNRTPDTVSVVDVAIDPASPAAASYAVDGSGCIGAALPGGATCAVDVTFAPVDTGDLVSAVLASLDDGTIVRGELTGLGAEPPVLSVVPGVASAGQVVSLIGAGFPAGATVQVSWDRGSEIESVEISDVGDLAHTLVVFPKTPRGPSVVTVLGQDGLFGGVTAEFLVSGNSSRPGSLVVRDLSPVRS